MIRALAMPAAIGLLALVAAAAGLLTGTGAEVARAQGFSLEIDTGPLGNTGAALSPTETCVAVGAGESFVVDVVAKEAPGLAGVEISINYNPQVLRVTGIQVRGLLLDKNPGANIINLSGPTPDEDGSYRPAAFDFNDTRPGGNGTVFRLTLETKAAGTSPLQIPTDDPSTFFDEGPVIPDPNQPTGQPGFTPQLAGAEVRVGQACSPGTAPPAPVRPEEIGFVSEPPPGTEPTPGPESSPGPAATTTPAAAERTPVASVTPREDGSDEEGTSLGGSGSGGDSGTDLTDMPWLALWVALGALAIGGGGGALLRLLARRMR